MYFACNTNPSRAATGLLGHRLPGVDTADKTLSMTEADPNREPPLQIVDAHHHLWDLDRVNYPWLMEKGVRRFFGDPTPIQRDYLLVDFRRDIGALPVIKSVHVQVGAAVDESVAETRWLQQTADAPDSGGMPHAVIAFCDLAAADAPAVLEAQREHPNVRGIRQILGRAAEEDANTGTGALLDDASWRRNLGRLPGLGLSFDLQLVPPQLPAVVRLLRDLPELRVALCHCGSPWDRSPEGLSFWRRHLGRLAHLPNVYCKLSGFGMFDRAWNAARVRDVVAPAIDRFGPGRCMFGSNFPVDKLYRDYAFVWDQYRALIRDFSAAERHALLAGTAEKFYRV